MALAGCSSSPTTNNNPALTDFVTGIQAQDGTQALRSAGTPPAANGGPAVTATTTSATVLNGSASSVHLHAGGVVQSGVFVGDRPIRSTGSTRSRCRPRQRTQTSSSSSEAPFPVNTGTARGIFARARGQGREQQALRPRGRRDPARVLLHPCLSARRGWLVQRRARLHRTGVDPRRTDQARRAGAGQSRLEQARACCCTRSPIRSFSAGCTSSRSCRPA